VTAARVLGPRHDGGVVALGERTHGTDDVGPANTAINVAEPAVDPELLAELAVAWT
jgi:hypothetical protein